MSRILLGVSGGIGCYKAAELVRLLIKQGHQVKVIMTRAAIEFISPLTMATLSQNPVYTELFDPAQPMDHISLAKWADLCVIAPATCHIIGKLAHGLADDLLSTLILATRATCLIAPAMNQAMWHHPLTQSNIERIETIGYSIIGPESGSQACGDTGLGRLVEPEKIMDAIQTHLCHEMLFSNQHILITAGPTIEKIDPVRFLSNYSSGKMGFALAKHAKNMGAKVTLIKGPTAIMPPAVDQIIEVESAEQMLQACLAVENIDIAIGTAAVSDYRCAEFSQGKIKKNSQNLNLELIENPDIINAISIQNPSALIVAFAAESEFNDQSLRAKMARKGAHMIAANDISNEAIGFNSDQNSLSVLTAENKLFIPKNSKDKIALQLLQIIKDHYESKNSTQNSRSTTTQSTA